MNRKWANQFYYAVMSITVIVGALGLITLGIGMFHLGYQIYALT